MAPLKSGLQALLDVISVELSNLNFKLTPTKCKYIRFRKGVFRRKEQIEIEGSHITQGIKAKYLDPSIIQVPVCV